MSRQNRAQDSLTRRPRRPSSKRQARRKAALAFYALLPALLCVCAILAWRLWHYQAARGEYSAYQAIAQESAAPLVSSIPETQAPAALPQGAPPTAIPKPFYSGKVALLQKDNRDAVAWLDIVGTDMRYPVVQGDDNEYYMTHTFPKKKNASGAIFLDSWNAADFTDFNTVIFGHNMNDGSMFGGLREYGHQRFANEHGIIEVTLLNKKLRYQVFAAYTAQSEEDADFRGQGCATEEQRSAFILAARKRAEIDSSQTVKRNDRLLTLVTCTSGTHPWYWVVHAVLVEEQMVAVE